MSVMTENEPSSLSIDDSVEQFLSAKGVEYTDETLRDYRSRLQQFVDWCEGNDIKTVGELSGWTFQQFRQERAGQDIAATTLKGQMNALRVWTKWLASIDAVDDSLPTKIDVPQPTRREETSDVRLDADDAQALLDHYRDRRAKYGNRTHVLLELLWFTGARLAAVRGLDVDDVDLETGTVHFKHRPDTGTGLKKKDRGERVVGLKPETVDALAVYLNEHRPAARDKHGREPLFATTHGRPAAGTLRDWTYYATVPCRHGPCPHDERPDRCDWNSQKGAHGCPSSRSPHQIRTGAITWMLNQGMSWDAVGHRVNSDPDTLRRYYDKASDQEKWRRHNDELDKLDFEGESNQ